MTFLILDSSSEEILLGPFVDDEDGVTPETGLAGTMTVYVSKNGAASAARSSATAITHDRAGYYRVELNGDDLDTPGRLTVFASPSGALPVKMDINVIYGDAYAFLFPGAVLDVNVAYIDDSATAAAAAAVLFDNSTAMGNLADMFDGTGFNAATSTIGTVTNLTNPPAGSDGDMVSLDGSVTAAENLRKAFDGTGYAASGLTIGSVSGVTNTVNANLVTISSSAALVTAFVALMRGAIVGTVASGTNTATVVTTNLTATTDDLYKDKVLLVTTGTHAGEGGKLVTAYAGSTKVLTVQALTGALTVGDTFVLVG